MKRIILFHILFCITINHVASQNIYYDAAFLKEYLNNGVFESDKKFNKQEDSLQKLDKLLDQQVKELKNDPNKMTLRDSLISERKALVPLLQKIREEKDDSLFSVLKKYFPEIKETDGSAEITAIIQKNPFFKTFIIQGAVK